MNKFLILLFIFTSSFAFEVRENSVPGGIKIINFQTNFTNPEVYFYKNKVYIKKLSNNKFQAIIGIPLNAKVGIHQITIKDFGLRKVNFKVNKHKYLEQRITLKKKKEKYITPSKKHITRIVAEAKILKSAKIIFSNLTIKKNFISPTTGIQTGVFGSRRFFNNQPRRPHSGIDIANKLNTDIKSINDGKVILTGNYYFNGKTIFIDHGKGLISVYIHLNNILISQGDSLKKGDIIGKMGKTGRATGVHLHYGILLNQVVINPSLLIK